MHPLNCMSGSLISGTDPLLKRIDTGRGGIVLRVFFYLDLYRACEDSTGLFLLSAKLWGRGEHPAGATASFLLGSAAGSGVPAG